jgi:hypothetical protein
VSSSKRWIDSESDADEAERSILRAGLGAEPPPGLEDELFRRVLSVAALPATLEPGALGSAVDPVVPVAGAVVGPAAVGGTVKAVSTLALLGKGFVAGVGVSVAVAAGQHWVTREPAPAHLLQSVRTTEPRAASSTPRVAAAMPESALPAPAAAASNAPIDTSEKNAIASRPPRSSGDPSQKDREPSPRLAQPTAASRPVSQLEEEAALLRAARQQLRQGALAAAFASLETSRQRFSAPALEQEREALMIELLYRSGQRAAAAARARAFLQQHVESPHRGQVQKFAE